MGADVIGALHQRRSNLQTRRARVKMERDDELRRIDREIEEIDRTLAVLNDAIKDYFCPHCGGSGTVIRPDAAGQMENVDCPTCHGTGVKGSGSCG